MQGRDALSVHRSMARAMSLILPSDYDVQPVRKEPQERPLCVVRPIGPGPSSGSAYVREIEQPFEILIYPEGVEANPIASEFEARAVMNAALRALDSGLPLPGRDKLYAQRVPLFDYSDLTVDDILPADRQPLDYLVLRLPSGQVLQDPEQDDLYTITIDLRVNWRDDGDLSRFEGTTITGVGVDFQPPA
jgi:hypothetical protein